jgi:hypothetical protein
MQRPEFLMTLARAAILANGFEYELLRPVLLEVKNLEVAERVAAFKKTKDRPAECAHVAVS